MKRIKWLVVGLLAICLALVSAINVYAVEFSTSSDNSTLTLPAEKTVNDNYVVAASMANIDGKISHDLIVSGGQVNINGEIDGNVFAAAGTVNVSGKIKGDLFIGAGYVTIAKDAVIDGDLSVGSGTLDIKGHVKGNVRSGSGTLNIDGKVDKNVNVSEDTLTIGSTAEILGNLKYQSKQDAQIASGAKIIGTKERVEPPAIVNNKQLLDLSIVGGISILGFSVLSFLGFILFGILLILIIPKKSAEIAEKISSKFWLSLGVGFLALIVTPAAFIILLISLIGIPAAVVLMMVYGLAIYSAKVFVGLVLGNLICKGKCHPIWMMILGVLIISIIQAVPFLGGFASFLVVLLGLGAIAMVIMKK